MRIHRRAVLAAILGMVAAGCAGRSGSSTGASDAAPAADGHVIRVVMTGGSGSETGRWRTTVNGKEVAPAALAEVLRSLKQNAACEMQMSADTPYRQVAIMLAAAAQADIAHLRLTTDGISGFDYSMPAIDSTGRSPSIQVTTEIQRKNGDTWVAPPGQPPVQMTRAGALDPAGNTRILDLLKRKSGDSASKVQMVLRPTADVPFGDIITVYSDCARAQYKAIAFAAPPGIAAPHGAASIKATGHAAPARAVKIVYIIDCSSAVADSLAGLKRELIESADRLSPVQQFDIVLLSEKSAAVFPGMQAATPEAKRELRGKFQDVKAQGTIEGKLQPFQDAFDAAFTMKPQIIYFMTESSFDPKLLDVVDGLNKDHQVRVHTLALVREDEKFREPLKEIAERNGGKYKFVAASALVNSDAPGTANGGR